ncbi:MAG: hypothetical protein IT427_14650 [Pirellulales bacterium]|nr:hypothetical protein [Pirellulales bacterium]
MMDSLEKVGDEPGFRPFPALCCANFACLAAEQAEIATEIPKNGRRWRPRRTLLMARIPRFALAAAAKMQRIIAAPPKANPGEYRVATDVALCAVFAEKSPTRRRSPPQP